MTAPTDTSAPTSGRTGRPRDPGLDAAILDATRALLVEHGYQGVTMQGVARIAGVHVPAIYRRWRTKFELVEAAVFPLDWQPPARTGRLRDDLRAYLGEMLRTFAEPTLRAAAPGLISESHNDPVAVARLAQRSAEYEAALRVIVGEAVTRRELEAAARDRVALLLNMMLGAALTMEVLSNTPVDDALVDQLTDFLLHGL